MIYRADPAQGEMLLYVSEYRCRYINSPRRGKEIAGETERQIPDDLSIKGYNMACLPSLHYTKSIKATRMSSFICTIIIRF
jgi:hypothetical protein